MNRIWPFPRRENYFQVQTNGKHTFYLHESTVKAAKEVVMDRQVSCKFEPLSKSFTNSHFQAASRNEGESVTLDMVSFKTVSKLSKFT